MPDSEAKSNLVNNGKPVQSAWLTHWTETKSETTEHYHLTQLNRSKENDLNNHYFNQHPTAIEISSDNFGFSKDVDLTMSLKIPSSQSLQLFKRGQESEKCSISNERVQAKLTGGLTLKTSSSECHIQPTNQIKHHMFFSERCYLSSQPSDQIIYKLENHTTHGPQNFRHLTDAFASKERLPDSEKTKMPSCTALLKTNNRSTINFRSLVFIEEQYKKMEKNIGMKFFPHSKSQTVYHEQCSSQNVVHDVKMTKMIGGFYGFFKTTESLLLTKQTNVKVFQLKKEALNELKCSPLCFGQDQQGVKIQLLDSSNPESLENVEENRAFGDFQKNESSADIDVMDIDCHKEEHLSGVHLFTTNKDIMMDLNVEKNKCRKRKREQSDINSENSGQPNASNSTDKTESHVSRTHSLDLSKLNYNLDPTTNSNSNQFSNSNNPGSEPESRWIKRLKLAETSSHEKINRFITTVTEGKRESQTDNCHGKNLESLTESSAVEITRECDEIPVSHSWIQRWSHKHNLKSPEARETCQLDKSELETDEIQKKQFPSIAALALMSRALAGISQCKLQRKESFVVWNTKVSVSNVCDITNPVLF